jgi:RHH-type proline utilization regulon transcriptional repressor/proline dehydrogenase/delta 1-pyrroline-5-carboxylate dehydrogenase
MHNDFESSVQKEGMELFAAMQKEQDSLFDKQAWLGKMLDWVMKDPSFKVDLFHFVDVLPMLESKEQVFSHIQEYLLKKDRELPLFMGSALKAASFSFAQGMATSLIKKNVTDMAQRFIAGENIELAAKSLQKLSSQGFCFTLDLLGEKTLSDKEADSYFSRYSELIKNIRYFVPEESNKNNFANISIKISALTCHLKEEAISYTINQLYDRVNKLIKLAQEHRVFINFDIESQQSIEIIYGLFHKIILSDDFKTWPHLGIVVQAYLLNAREHLERLITLAKQRACPITIRLVKGAYWDYEVVRAQKLGLPCPVFRNKAASDLNFEALSQLLIDNIEYVRAAFASHNIRSLAAAISYAKKKSVDKSNYEIQMLYGMGESEAKVFVKRGHCVRIYSPLGEILPGMAYLVRRLLENTSQMGFLKLSHHDNKDASRLLMPPKSTNNPIVEEFSSDFKNISATDFGLAENRRLFLAALSEIKRELPFSVPVVISGEKRESSRFLSPLCPSDTTLALGTVHLASVQDTLDAVKASNHAFLELFDTSLSERVGHLLELAKILEHDRLYLAALICIEVGKCWAEADADVAEAIDFCRYYAERAQIELSDKILGDLLSEENRLYYQGRGPSVVIAPWNFPLAILCGMSVAAYVAQNPIIIKPAEQSSIIAYELFKRMLTAGFKAHAVQFLPGLGEEVGAQLVKHPDIATIAFTGSMAVGHEIVKSANTVVFGQIQMKRVISEMGGKNAIIIDDDADLDEAVKATMESAFSFSGQKCSAASRVIVVGTIFKSFKERLVEASRSLIIGSSLNPESDMGPVIDKESYERLLAISQKLSIDQDLDILYQGYGATSGYFVPPLIVEPKNAQHWLMCEELFGPILALYHVADIEHALAVANQSRYALTGAIFSRSPKNIAKARKRFNVGNLYINQKCTGAMVNRQPFGGFKMSGTGIKAGGPFYLLNFVDAKLISENTMRSGFTPKLSV